MCAAARSDKQGYLGLLLTNEDSKVYGYITCTQTKFIAVLDYVGAKETVAKEVCCGPFFGCQAPQRRARRLVVRACAQFFEALHRCFITAVANPFYVQDKKIVSQAFDRAVTSACHQYFG